MNYLRCFDDHASSPPRPAIIAEMSGNHGGSLDRALSIVDAVASAGVELLKIQTYTADTLTIDVDHPRFVVSDEQALWRGRTLFDLYQEAHTPWDWHDAIFTRARERGITPFSSPFDPSAVELLEKLDCELYKMASAEIVDLPLIREVARTGKPLIISTGMATISEIESALDAARSVGSAQVALLACTAAYPAEPADARLGNIETLRRLFGVPVGLSDHTLGIGVAVAACALGAVMIEKHVTLSVQDDSVDSEFSMTPEDFTQLVRESENAWLATSVPGRIGPTESEQAVRLLRRSLCIVQPVSAGDVVTSDNVRSIRPAGGLAPDSFDLVAGRAFTTSAPAGTPLTWDLL